MMKVRILSVITITLLTFVSKLATAQEVHVDACSILEYALEHKTLDTFDYFLNSPDLNFDRPILLSFKGYAMIHATDQEVNLIDSSIVTSANLLFQEAIDLADEVDKIDFVYRRYSTLFTAVGGYSNRKQDLDILYKHGYKEGDMGFSVFAASRYDGDLWAGIELSVFGMLDLPYKIKNNIGEVLYENKYGISASVLTYSYLRNTFEDQYENRFSIFRLEAPIYIDITQFGFVNAFDRNRWFYRPEVGVGLGRFSISYSYSLFTKSESRQLLNKHSLNFRTKFVF